MLRINPSLCLVRPFLSQINTRTAAAAAKLLQSCPTLWDPIAAAHQAPPSTGFPRQEHWSGFPFPSPNIMTGIGFLRPEALYHLKTEGWIHPLHLGHSVVPGAYNGDLLRFSTGSPSVERHTQTKPVSPSLLPCAAGAQDPSVPWHKVQGHFQTQSLCPKSILSRADHVMSALHRPIVPRVSTHRWDGVCHDAEESGRWEERV